MQLRHNWTRDEIRQVFDLPLPELIFQAQRVHRELHPPDEVQLCRLLSIKTGGCPEDCAYCPQSAHYETGVSRQALIDPQEALDAAARAKEEGATRFCMGAAWRQAPQGKEFESVPKWCVASRRLTWRSAVRSGCSPRNRPGN
jgi:biotin synthase